MTPIDDGSVPGPFLKSPKGQRVNSKRERRRRNASRVGLGALALALVGGGAGALLMHQATSVRTELQNAMHLISQLRSDLENGDHQAATITLETIQGETSSARSTTTAPLWKSASYIPGLGRNFSAVREVAVSADDIAVRAAGPLLDRSDLLNWQTLSPTDGRFDIGRLEEAAPSLSIAANTVRQSYQRMASLDVPRLIPEIAQPVGEATEQLQELSQLLDRASSTAQLLPGMLGASGPRDYLVLVQNNSETRATGGIPGALAVLHTDDGRISLGEQTSAGALGAFRPLIDVDSQQVSLYTERLGTQMQNVNLTPDFPTAAQTAKEMWKQRRPLQEIDGVLALDTVVLSHLLEATGPVDLVDPQLLDKIQDTDLPLSLTKDNVVPTLLSKVYKEIEDPEEQDAYFAAVASRVFSAFTEGQGEGGQLIKALHASTKEDRLFLWSSHPAEQEIIATTPVHGSVTGPDSGGAAFGAYFNDGTGAKMDYYVTRTVQVIQACPVGDYGRYTVRVAVTNNAPTDAASSLPAYVTGGGAFDVEPGRVRTNYVMYGPAQSFVESARVNGETVPVGSGKHGQRPVGTLTQELAPGETAILEVDFTRVVQDSEPLLHVTPTVQPVKDVVLSTIRAEACQ